MLVSKLGEEQALKILQQHIDRQQVEEEQNAQQNLSYEEFVYKILQAVDALTERYRKGEGTQREWALPKCHHLIFGIGMSDKEKALYGDPGNFQLLLCRAYDQRFESGHPIISFLEELLIKKISFREVDKRLKERICQGVDNQGFKEHQLVSKH
jgi:hypothetical protein